MLPSLFISHGSPALSLTNNETKRFFQRVASLFEVPKYILVISAHWTTNKLEILANENPELMYDFYSFPQELYTMKYPIQNSIEKVDEVVKLLEENGIDIVKNKNRIGYDHGVWSPLKLIYRDANIPIIQLSLPLSYTPQELIALGEILYPLRKDTLIVSSGNMTHNLGLINWREENPKPQKYAVSFRDWIVEKLEKGDKRSLEQFIIKAPYVRENHPTLEHFLPLFVTLGASNDSVGESLNDCYEFGNLSMDSIIFGS